ncbi:uncharacterized protein TNCV_2267401 [Trichonephila clavipes]|nr:uncharacterized protein TNCV_2267401 [Trichonephila clavipes]
MVIREGILYKGNLTCNPRCSRRQRMHEENISTHVAVDQHATKCVDEAVRSFTTMRSRCRSSHAGVTFRRPLPVSRVVRGSLGSYSKLAPLCKTAHELLLRGRKILLLKGR